MRVVRDQQLRAVLKLDPLPRYGHFIKFVCDTRRVWGMWEGDGWVLVGGEGGAQSLPVWPAREYASHFLRGPFHSSSVKEMSLGHLVHSLLFSLSDKGRRLLIFPLVDDSGAVSSGVFARPSGFIDDLSAELSSYGCDVGDLED